MHNYFCTGRIPKGKLHDLIFHGHARSGGLKDCGHVGAREGIILVGHQQAGLPAGSIPDDDELAPDGRSSSPGTIKGTGAEGRDGCPCAAALVAAGRVTAVADGEVGRWGLEAAASHGRSSRGTHRLTIASMTVDGNGPVAIAVGTATGVNDHPYWGRATASHTCRSRQESTTINNYWSVTPYDASRKYHFIYNIVCGGWDETR